MTRELIWGDGFDLASGGSGFSWKRVRRLRVTCGRRVFLRGFPTPSKWSSASPNNDAARNRVIPSPPFRDGRRKPPKKNSSTAKLLEAALTRFQEKPLPPDAKTKPTAPKSTLFVIDYTDDLRASILMASAL